MHPDGMMNVLTVNGQPVHTGLVGVFATHQADGTVSIGIQVDLTEADTSSLTTCELQFACSVGVFGKDGKATQWQKEILTATITFK